MPKSNSPDLVGLNTKVSPAERRRVEKLARSLECSLKSVLLTGVALLEEHQAADKAGDKIKRHSKRGKVTELRLVGMNS